MHIPLLYTSLLSKAKPSSMCMCVCTSTVCIYVWLVYAEITPRLTRRWQTSECAKKWSCPTWRRPCGIICVQSVSHLLRFIMPPSQYFQCTTERLFFISAETETSRNSHFFFWPKPIPKPKKAFCFGRNRYRNRNNCIHKKCNNLSTHIDNNIYILKL